MMVSMKHEGTTHISRELLKMGAGQHKLSGRMGTLHQVLESSRSSVFESVVTCKGSGVCGVDHLGMVREEKGVLVLSNMKN